MDETKSKKLTGRQIEVKEILQRLYYLKHKFKSVVPDNLAAFNASLREPTLEGITKYDLLYSVGVVFSRQQEPLSMGDLSRALDVPLSNATRIVDWMVQNGYVQRLPDPEDRRVVRVALTEAGEEIYRTLNDLFAERANRLMEFFTPEEQENLIHLLRKLTSILEDKY